MHMHMHMHMHMQPPWEWKRAPVCVPSADLSTMEYLLFFRFFFFATVYFALQLLRENNFQMLSIKYGGNNITESLSKG